MRKILATLALCAIVFGLVSAASAHIHERPDLDQWIMSLSAKDRGPCCDSKEAETMADPDWRNASEMKPGECDKGNAGITSEQPPVFCVRLEHPDKEHAGEFTWYEVPPGAIVIETAPDGTIVPAKNRAGPALIWLYWVRGVDSAGTPCETCVKPYIRCFLPGAMG